MGVRNSWALLDAKARSASSAFLRRSKSRADRDADRFQFARKPRDRHGRKIASVA